MSQPSDDGLGADDLLNTLTGYFEPESAQVSSPSENEALQLEIDAWIQAQKRPAQLQSEPHRTSHRIAELAPPPVAESVSTGLKAASLDLLGDLDLGGGGRREEEAAASPANAMMERALQRRRRQRADAGRQLDPRSATHPIDTSGAPCGAEVDFATSLHDKGDGFYDIDLHVAGEPAVRGRARFVDRCPKEAAVLVARALSLRGNDASAAELTISVAELTHLDVASPLRGGGGGIALMAAMGDALADCSCSYVLLDHYDKGSGRLVRFYEGLGFEFARAVLAEAVLDDGELDQLLTDKHMLAPLAAMREALALA